MIQSILISGNLDQTRLARALGELAEMSSVAVSSRKPAGAATGLYDRRGDDESLGEVERNSDLKSRLLPLPDFLLKAIALF